MSYFSLFYLLWEPRQWINIKSLYILSGMYISLSLHFGLPSEYMVPYLFNVWVIFSSTMLWLKWIELPPNKKEVI